MGEDAGRLDERDLDSGLAGEIRRPDPRRQHERIELVIAGGSRDPAERPVAEIERGDLGDPDARALGLRRGQKRPGHGARLDAPLGARPHRAQDRLLRDHPRFEFGEAGRVHEVDRVAPALVAGELLPQQARPRGVHPVLEASAPEHPERAAELGLEPTPSLNAEPIQLEVGARAFREVSH